MDRQQRIRIRLSDWASGFNRPVIASILIAMLGIGALSYQQFTSPGAFFIYPPQNVIAGADPVLITSGRTEVTCASSGRVGVIVVVGQSLSVNNVPTPYIPVQAVDQLNIYDGKCYAAKDPLLGINVSGGAVTDLRGTWMSRMADNLVSNGKFDRVVLVPMAVGGTSVSQWASNSAAPYLLNNISVIGLRLAHAKLSCSAIMWGQGESDTSAETSQSNYSSALAKVISEFNRVMPGCPILVAQESYYYGKTSSAVLAAQVAAVNGVTVFAGENVDSIPSSQRYDDTRLNDTGAATRASLAEAALVTALGL